MLFYDKNDFFLVFCVMNRRRRSAALTPEFIYVFTWNERPFRHFSKIPFIFNIQMSDIQGPKSADGQLIAQDSCCRAGGDKYEFV